MSESDEKKLQSEAYARALVKRLAPYKPPLVSETDWCLSAGLSRSFLSNMRGTPTKGPSVPSIEKVEALLATVDVTLAEFYAPLSKGRVGILPSEQALERRLAQALVTLPKKPADRLPYLVEALREILVLPGNQPPNRADAGDEEADVPAAAARARVPTSH